MIRAGSSRWYTPHQKIALLSSKMSRRRKRWPCIGGTFDFPYFVRYHAYTCDIINGNRTWILTTEPIMDPPRLLKEECHNADVPDGDFDICGLGETRFF